MDSWQKEQTSHLLSLTEPRSAGLGRSANLSEEPWETPARCPPRAGQTGSSHHRALPATRSAPLPGTVSSFEWFSLPGPQAAMESRGQFQFWDTSMPQSQPQARQAPSDMLPGPASRTEWRPTGGPSTRWALSHGAGRGPEPYNSASCRKAGLGYRAPAVYQTAASIQGIKCTLFVNPVSVFCKSPVAHTGQRVNCSDSGAVAGAPGVLQLSQKPLPLMAVFWCDLSAIQGNKEQRSWGRSSYFPTASLVVSVSDF